MKENRIFKIHWLDGRTEEIQGTCFDDAMLKAGHRGLGIFKEIDFWEEI